MDRVVHNSGVIEEMKLRDKRRESKKEKKEKTTLILMLICTPSCLPPKSKKCLPALNKDYTFAKKKFNWEGNCHQRKVFSEIKQYT